MQRCLRPCRPNRCSASVGHLDTAQAQVVGEIHHGREGGGTLPRAWPAGGRGPPRSAARLRLRVPLKGLILEIRPALRERRELLFMNMGVTRPP